MLRKRTGSALTYSFQRFAHLALVCLALAGLAACGGGGGGGSTPPSTTLTPPLTWVVTDQCNDNRDIDLRFFQYHRSRIGAQPTSVWPPSSSAVHRTRGFGEPTTFRLACTRGQSQVVCYGGRNRGDTSGYYGRDLDGNQDCQNCCFQCPSDSSTTRRVGLTCAARVPTTTPVTPPPPPSGYGAISLGDRDIGGVQRLVWSFGVGTSSSAALADARTRCASKLGESCTNFSDTIGRNQCGALVPSDNLVNAFAKAGSVTAATDTAVERCRSFATGPDQSTCRVRSGSTFCPASSSNPPSGQVDRRTPTPLPSGLPPVYNPRTAPQASGTDIPNIEISGLGTTRRFAVRNTGSTTAVIRAGTWYEPRDGSFQRMIVTRTTSVPPGQVVEVPIACMQERKRAPARGLRFFSSPKGITGPVQQCQQRCLSDIGSSPSLQRCVWACERSAPTPPVTPTPVTPVTPTPPATPVRGFAVWGRRGLARAFTGYSWRIETGTDSYGVLESRARQVCEGRTSGLRCGSGSAITPNTCFALAVSDEYAIGFQDGARTRQQAETAAIQACRSDFFGGAHSTCRIAPATSGNPPRASVCLGTAR